MSKFIHYNQSGLEFRDKYILIIGGNSDVGKALARSFAKLGANLILTSRRQDQLNTFKSDLEIRYQISCELKFLNILKFEEHQRFYDELSNKPAIVITTVGYLNNQEEAQKVFVESLKSIQTNFTGLVSILNIIANDFEKRKSGILVGISSVAGNRGRASNYIYGSAKAAYTTYLSGLRNRLNEANVQVITVKPGFIKTKMTNHLKLPSPLTASPEEVATDIIKATRKKKDAIYTRWFWKWIMVIITIIPEFLFKKMKL